ncbi:MAG: hypothetical protein LC754_10120 [Acidobacteria bacterium]|nr:hypothetical protein [Acidobacteriota bacterium]
MMNPQRFTEPRFAVEEILMGITKPDLKAEALRLRLEERLSLREIASVTGAAKGSLNVWLQSYPLTDEEKKARSKTAKRYVTPKKSHGEESKHHQATAAQTLTNQQRGRIAEAAVLFRLVLHGFEVYTSAFDGDKVDCLVYVPESGKTLKLQVRYVNSPSTHGLPVVRLSCAEGHSKRRRYKEGEFDFIIGYYLFNDTAYVFSFDELVQHKRHVTVSDKYAERWDKLRT